VTQTRPSHAALALPEAAHRNGPPLHDARDLTGPQGQAQIRLDDQTYTLRITRAGKLILTK
jgi:hemin uptake protein HemP